MDRVWGRWTELGWSEVSRWTEVREIDRGGGDGQGWGRWTEVGEMDRGGEMDGGGGDEEMDRGRGN